MNHLSIAPNRLCWTDLNQPVPAKLHDGDSYVARLLAEFLPLVSPNVQHTLSRFNSKRVIFQAQLIRRTGIEVSIDFDLAAYRVQGTPLNQGSFLTSVWHNEKRVWSQNFNVANHSSNAKREGFAKIAQHIQNHVFAVEAANEGRNAKVAALEPNKWYVARFIDAPLRNVLCIGPDNLVYDSMHAQTFNINTIRIEEEATP